MFSVVVLLFTFAYRLFAPIVWAIVTLFLLFALACMLADILNARREGRPGMFWIFVGVLCFFAVLVGALAGFFNYHRLMSSYWAYEGRRMYANVRPSESAIGHSDAGMIEFSADAHIWVDHSLGYTDGDLYCVAPIVAGKNKSAATSGLTVEYFAAGENCCGQRGGFTCNDAGVPSAHAGLVILETSPYVPSNLDEYRKAAVEAGAALGMAVSTDPVFIKWTANPQAMQDTLWENSVGFLAGCIIMHWLFSVIVGFVRHYTSRPGKGALSDATQGGASGKKGGRGPYSQIA